MHWIAPSEKDAANDTLEKRLWAASDQLRANSGLTSDSLPIPASSFIPHPSALFRPAITYCEDLNRRALRRLAVLRPLKVVITNLPENHHEELDALNNPEDPATGTRKLPFSRELWIEQDDFAEVPPPKFFRLKPGGEVRLKYAYIIKCDEVIKDPTGKVVELRCTADLDSKTGGATSGRKIKGTIHWVSAKHTIDAECRLYDRLFTAAEPDADGDFKKNINPHSLEVVTCKAEPSVTEAKPELRYQFEP